MPLLAFTGLYVLVYVGESIKYAYLPIYMNDDLQLAPVVSGAVIGIQPLVELLLMPVAVIVARAVEFGACPPVAKLNVMTCCERVGPEVAGHLE